MNTAPSGFLEQFCQAGLQQCIQGFYNFLVGIAIASAFLFIVIGALEYLISAAINKKEQGKKKITGAIIGLLVIFTSGVVLYWINPNIFNAELIIYKVINLQPPKFIPNDFVLKDNYISNDYGGAKCTINDIKNKCPVKEIRAMIAKFTNMKINGLKDAEDKVSLITALSIAESNCNANAVNRNSDAAGLLQIIPMTSRCEAINSCGAGLNCPASRQEIINALKNPNVNICMSLQILSGSTNSCKRYGSENNLDPVLRGYLNGPGRLKDGTIGCVSGQQSASAYVQKIIGCKNIISGNLQ